LLKRHFARYTPEMVEQVCGSPKEKFIKVAEMLLENSGRDRTSAFAYAVAWTQHTYGVQMISCCALLQLLLGNIGRPGAGVMALRGHAAIQGSTDVPTLYHSIHGYLNAPSALRPHETLRDYMAAETSPTSYYGNLPKFLVSYLKSMYGAAATAENDFGYDWHPKILGDHSHIAEYDGSFTNTQRMLQWHSFAAKAPGDCRTDSWFYHNLAKRLKKAYADSKLPRDQGWTNLSWDFDPDAGEEPLYPGEISARKVLREIN